MATDDPVAEWTAVDEMGHTEKLTGRFTWALAEFGTSWARRLDSEYSASVSRQVSVTSPSAKECTTFTVDCIAEGKTQ